MGRHCQSDILLGAGLLPALGKVRHEFFQTGFENLQGRKVYHLSVCLCHNHMALLGKSFFLVSHLNFTNTNVWAAFLQAYGHRPLWCHLTLPRNVWLHLWSCPSSSCRLLLGQPILLFAQLPPPFSCILDPWPPLEPSTGDHSSFSISVLNGGN